MKNQSGVFAQRMEFDFRPLLGGDIDLYRIRCKEGRRTHRVMRHTVRIGIDEALQFPLVVTGHPARRDITRRRQPRFAAVFMFQPVRDHLGAPRASIDEIVRWTAGVAAR